MKCEHTRIKSSESLCRSRSFMGGTKIVTKRRCIDCGKILSRKTRPLKNKISSTDTTKEVKE